MIYVTGSDGQLGQELRKKLPEATFLTRKEIDLANPQEIESFLSSTKITTLINCAAYTQVDKAETEQAHCMSINEAAPDLMARYSKSKNFKFIHFSTDYVFNGNGCTPYKETDVCDPLNFYGESKLAGEQRILQENEKSLIIRTSWVYSSFGKNFVKTILKAGAERESLNVVYDQVGTLTWASDLADITIKAQQLEGVFHYTNEGVSSWYDVAHALKKIKNFKAAVNPILSSGYPTPAKRPHYSVLDKQKIKSALNITIPHWTESLELCLKELS